MDVEEKFRAALNEESDYPLTDELYDYILSHSIVEEKGKGEIIISAGVFNPDAYIIKQGIVRGYLHENGVENNLYFGMEGTFITSMQSFWAGEPSFLQIESCGPSTLLRIRKSTFDKMMAESYDFCRWIAGVYMRGSYYNEIKGKIMSGDASWRYEWLEKCRPELFEVVPLKAIASYLKMSEVHVSRIRKKILSGEYNGHQNG